MESGGKREKRLIIETLNRLTSHPRFLRIPGRLHYCERLESWRRRWEAGEAGGAGANTTNRQRTKSVRLSAKCYQISKK